MTTLLPWPPPSAPRAPRSVPLHEWARGAARAVVDAQLALDEKARDAMRRWETDGVMPSAFYWKEVGMAAPVAVRADEGEEGRARLLVAPRERAHGRVALRLRMAPQRQEDIGGD